MATTAKKTASATPNALALRIAQESAPAWRPSEGETLTFRLVSAKVSEGGDYAAYPLLTVQRVDNDEYVNVHAFHGVLQAGLADLAKAGKLTKGDVATIHYVGYVEKNDSKKKFAAGGDEKEREYYHHYLVFSGDGTEDDDTEEVDFTAFGQKN